MNRDSVATSSALRFAMPIVRGRGAGLGNEMIVWAKAYIAGQILGARTLHPAWGLNQREYWRYFDTSRLDWAAHRALRASLPYFEFNVGERRRFGGDLETALRAFADHHHLDKRRAFVVGMDGMDGGFHDLQPARSFLLHKLLGARDALSNLYATERRLGEGLRIGLHVRRGDFGSAAPDLDYRGRFNVAIPLQWYVNVVEDLVSRIGPDVRFLIVSDALEDELRPLLDAAPQTSLAQGSSYRDVSDLLALASCDFLVCSISSYSLWAAFLSGRRYGWYGPNLTVDEGFGSIWGHEPNQRLSTSETSTARITEAQATERASLKGRGVALGADGVVPESLIEDLREMQALKRRSGDLLRYGVVPWS